MVATKAGKSTRITVATPDELLAELSRRHRAVQDNLPAAQFWAGASYGVNALLRIQQDGKIVMRKTEPATD